MDFLDKVASVAKEVGETVSATASDLYEKGKEKAAEIGAKADLRDELRKLGELSYRAAKGETVDEDEKTAIIATIDGLKIKIAELEAERAKEN